MGQARTNRRRRKQMVMNNAQFSGPGVPRYGARKDASARAKREQRKLEKWRKTGSSMALGGGQS